MAAKGEDYLSIMHAYMCISMPPTTQTLPQKPPIAQTLPRFFFQRAPFQRLPSGRLPFRTLTRIFFQRAPSRGNRKVDCRSELYRRGRLLPKRYRGFSLNGSHSRGYRRGRYATQFFVEIDSIPNVTAASVIYDFVRDLKNRYRTAVKPQIEKGMMGETIGLPHYTWPHPTIHYHT